MRVIVNSPFEEDIDNFQVLKNNIANVSAILILEKIRKLQIDDESKKKILEKIFEILKSNKDLK